ncbi:hypothetical protein ASG43_16040 [Aureimonas sp. Leaf454]|uniref:MSMEG_0570 family nitrogen starvation response protein n=1 Tax=Aureimonas sp. Leaf454 TaxID=1736381 RepID=UPI0006F8192D|nr:MSMEG_0570 family nitrogen starvation response protein [Aureimonas sp. Leaf454]KQT43040.1 hypothetical protein ASG43_16040 [Aureimonas sp. Leaf454]
MPEVRFTIRWPDGTRRDCYSPSTVIREHLVSGAVLPLPVFLATIRTGLGAASRRVEERYGRPCGIVARELAEIESTARRQSAEGHVTVESLS